MHWRYIAATFLPSTYVRHSTGWPPRQAVWLSVAVLCVLWCYTGPCNISCQSWGETEPGVHNNGIQNNHFSSMLILILFTILCNFMNDNLIAVSHWCSAVSRLPGNKYLIVALHFLGLPTPNSTTAWVTATCTHGILLGTHTPEDILQQVSPEDFNHILFYWLQLTSLSTNALTRLYSNVFEEIQEMYPLWFWDRPETAMNSWHMYHLC